MMNRTVALLALLLAMDAGAQQHNAAPKYASTITAAELKKKLTVIAGAGMEGRETAMPGQKKAAAFIANYFKSIGLQPGTPDGYQMFYPVYRDSLQASAIRINGNELETDKAYAVNPSSIATGSWNSKDVVFAAFGLTDSSRNDFDGLDVKGKWVLLIDGTPADMDKTAEAGNYANYRAARLKTAQVKAKGVAGILVVTNDFPKATPSERLGNMYVEQSKTPIVPVVNISLATAAQILGKPLQQFTDLKTTVRGIYPVQLQLNASKTTDTLQSSNVLGVLPGTDKKDEYVFVTGHYDHLGRKGSVIYYGADDDGSGTASVLQIANAFARARAAGKGPRRTMVFMTVSGEEKGLWGSDYYTSHPLFPLAKTSVDLNIDMVGRIDPDYKGDSVNYLYVIGEDKLSSDLLKISDSINSNITRLELDRRFNDPKDPNRFYYRSDHYNFAKNGVPVIFYFNGVHADYHKPTDTVDKINFPLMEKRARLVFYTAWPMANRDQQLQRDIPLK